MSSQEVECIPNYRIPTDDTVTALIIDVMRETPTVRSQRLLHKLVSERIAGSNGNDSYRISERRIRRLAALSRSIELQIYCREGEEREFRNICPVCGKEMKPIRNATLYGWTVSTGRACDLCGYWTGKKERIPTRYVFMTVSEAKMEKSGDLEADL